MHEMAVAGAVLELALRHAGGRRVEAVGLEVGWLRQVVPRALAFSWELVSRGTLAEGARLEMAEVPATAACRSCGDRSQQSSFPLLCGGCGSLDVEVVRGEELRVQWLDLEEPDGSGSAATRTEEGQA